VDADINSLQGTLDQKAGELRQFVFDNLGPGSPGHGGLRGYPERNPAENKGLSRAPKYQHGIQNAVFSAENQRNLREFICCPWCNPFYFLEILPG
jgi:hypothetical protein